MKDSQFLVLAIFIILVFLNFQDQTNTILLSIDSLKHECIIPAVQDSIFVESYKDIDTRMTGH